MTDNEIIKALECCAAVKCYECPLRLYRFGSRCVTKLAKEALELIQRQQERIERLKDNLDAVLSERATLDVDRVVEQLEKAAFSVPDENDDEDLWVIDLYKAIEIVKGVQNE